jgi:hypothetical protein
VNVPGTARADYWQDVLEVFDTHGFRLTAPIPPKQAGTYRVLVVGDSITYGQGIDERFRFSNLLEQWLGADYRIEFVNLGHQGYQSEDVLATIQRFLPATIPDLVLYAVCLNDFLPSGVGQYGNLTRFAVPLPEPIKNYLLTHSRAAAFTSELFDGTLRRFRLRLDFFDDILKDFAGYQTRFARDVAAMNREITAAGLPPMVAMVVDQFPIYGDRGHQIARAAEHHLIAGSAEVIPTEDYYRKFNGRPMNVSPWEGHPDEVANWIWAQMIAKAIRSRRDLQPFAKASGARTVISTPP